MDSQLNIAIQGGPASFHDMATREFFQGRELNLVPCDTFRQLCQRLAREEVHYAVMAIENTLAGSILPNYTLLESHPVQIIGEVYLHISQNLIGHPGTRIGDLQTVRSHPMALMQCSDFLESHPHLKGVETSDTAESARELSLQPPNGVAVIASKRAAELYHLEIIAADIENLKDNYTRFLVLSRQGNPHHPLQNKASLNFTLAHSVGSLAGALNIFGAHDLNMTLIQSVPIPRKPHEYAFHVDVVWEQRENFEKAMRDLRQHTGELRILGIYQKGERPYDRQTR